MAELKMSQLVKEMAASSLRGAADPAAAAAAFAAATMRAGLSAGAPPEPLIEDSVKGAMTALLMAEGDLPRGALMMLEAALAAAGERQLDPTEAMLSALGGLASLRRLLEPSRMDDIRQAVEGAYHGAGRAFAERLERDALRAPVAA